jgi:DNA invertase Pin-like site-specific DNA recombinase
MTTYGYARVSTKDQADNGESLKTQERMIQGYAMTRGLPDPVLFIESAVSGSTPFIERPEGSKLLAALQPGDTIITPKMDRAFRSAIDALTTLDRLNLIPVSLHMMDIGDVSAPGTGKLIFTILAAVAEGERDRIRQRIREVKQDQKGRGMFLGGKVPFGFSVALDTGSPMLVPDPAQQDAIAFARSLHCDGKSLRKIVAALGERGFTISHQGVKDVLARAPAIAAE